MQRRSCGRRPCSAEGRFFQPLRSARPHGAGASARRRGHTRFQPVLPSTSRGDRQAVDGSTKAGADLRARGPDVAPFKELMDSCSPRSSAGRAAVPCRLRYEAQAAVLQFLPKPPITLTKKVELLQARQVRLRRGAARGRTLEALGSCPSRWRPSAVYSGAPQRPGSSTRVRRCNKNAEFSGRAPRDEAERADDDPPPGDQHPKPCRED